MSTILVVSADIIGSKKIADKPGGVEAIRLCRDQMQSDLTVAITSSARGMPLNVTEATAAGDNVELRLAGANLTSLANAILRALPMVLSRSNVGKKFRYTVFPIDADIQYHPRFSAFGELGKNEGTEYHFAIDRSVTRAVGADVASWYSQNLAKEVEIKFSAGESATGTVVHLFCPIGEAIPVCDWDSAAIAATQAPRRKDSIAILEHMIDDCQARKSELCVAGIANSDFFGAAGDRLNKRLRRALEAGMSARFIFLDPASRNAVRRSGFERKRLGTIREINACLETARQVRLELGEMAKKDPARKLGRLHIRLAPEMPCFLCLNGSTVLVHPYFTSVSGHEMPISVSAGESLERAQVHFEHLWGERWVLFDLGNVLIPFNHKRVSRGLVRFLPKGRQPKASAAQIHSFIFDSHEGPSCNSQLDRGSKDLRWLGEQLRERFKITVTEEQLRDVWCSVFDDLDSNAMNCLFKAKALGLRVSICSNTNTEHWAFLESEYPQLADSSVERFLSFKMKKVKTDAGFFESIAEHTGRPPEYHMLIDDVGENLAAAHETGMHTLKTPGPVRYEDVEEFIVENCWG